MDGVDSAGPAVVVSSAEVYGPHHSNPGRILESRPPNKTGNSVQQAWLDYEERARLKWPADKLAILRCAPTITKDGRDFYSDMFRSDRAWVLPGHVGTLQLLHPDDLEEAIRCVTANFQPGVYNIAPAGSIPLDGALEIAGVARMPFPRLVQYAIRGMMHGKAWPPDQLDYIRYQWTVSGELAEQKLGFKPRYSSAQTLKPDTTRTFDEFGMDLPYIERWGRGGFKVLHKHYWRIETRGLGNIPKSGKAVLTGVHRGFMPFDATMILDACMKGVGRAPRFLIHPCLVKMPGLNNAMTRWGGMVANQENADWVLNRGELLGVYPEGIRGAFAMYKDAYKLKRFGRDDYVRIAIRNRAPIVPFVTVGHVEIYPILGRIDIGAFNRWTEWPFCPITPTWPLLPVPLPTKWHTEFLPPVDLSAHPPETADDNIAVKRISEGIRGTMQGAIDALLAARKGLFTGTIFKGELS
jgi:1-acyl-sn-glycerol-3-phosphate acyltransferase